MGTSQLRLVADCWRKASVTPLCCSLLVLFLAVIFLTESVQASPNRPSVEASQEDETLCEPCESLDPVEALETREKQVADREKMLIRRERQLRTRESVMEEREKRIEEREVVFGDREKRIDTKQALVLDKEAEVMERERLSDEREAKLDETEILLEEKERLIQEKEKRLERVQALGRKQETVDVQEEQANGNGTQTENKEPVGRRRGSRVRGRKIQMHRIEKEEESDVKDEE